MGFLDNLDANLEDIKDNLEYISKKLLSESKDIKQAAKLKYEIFNENRILSELYEKLGVHSYKLIKKENSDLVVDEIIEEIDKHRARISSLEMGLDLNVNTNNDSVENNISLIDDKGEDSIIIIEDEDEGK